MHQTGPFPPRKLTAKGAATRDRIVAAAAELILAKGVAATSLDDVMAVSGASKSQLYHYFADKDALVAAVISYQAEHVLSGQRRYLGALDDWPALIAWRDAVVDVARRVALESGCPVGSLASELSPRSEAARKQLSESLETWRILIEDGLAVMQRRGILDASADPHIQALGLLAALQGGLLLAKTHRSTAALEAGLDMALASIKTHLTCNSHVSN